ncbi:MAG: FAD-binding oxidoreductase [Arenicellales bacterium]
MKLKAIDSEPSQDSYDVVIIGGAIMGSSAAWFLSSDNSFDGRILVVEKDPTYHLASTSLTNSCIRQQFSSELNVRISQYGVEFLRNFRKNLGGDSEIPDITLNSFGYLYLADNESFAEVLRTNQAMQRNLGAGTRIMTRDEIAAEYPFYNLDGIILGSHNPVDEGYFDGSAMFSWWRRKARENGVEYLTNEVVEIGRSGNRVENIRLKSGETISAGTIVNASGPRASLTARMAGLEVPIEPRRRFTFIFDAETPLEQDLPLTIDPSGVHVRGEGLYYLCGCPPDDDRAADFDDFEPDHDIWQQKLWPAVANRIPAFETVKVINSWVGHYAYNVLDHNAVVGPHPEVTNFMFLNGFSGHGLQQSSAMGRGIAELIMHGVYRELDMSPLGYQRIFHNQPFLERAII